MRVYVPMTPSRLAAAYRAREIGPAPLMAYAVTPALREWYASGDDEELEYAALTQAARAALGLLAAERSPEGSAGSISSAGLGGSGGSGGSAAAASAVRRVVVACEAGEVALNGDAGGSGDLGGGGDLGDAGMTLRTPVPWSAVAAVHVDAAESAVVIESAVAVWDEAQNGDEEALFTVEASDGEELLWYATQEVPDLLLDLAPGGQGDNSPTQRS